MYEGGPDRWIGYYVSTDEDIYMIDGSYVQVCNEIYPGKVSWIGGDHSAVTTSIPGRWISKWNKYPLIEHDKDDTPFGTNYAYYASTKVSGATDNLCSGTRTFNVINIPNATYAWTYSSTLSVVGSINTNQIIVQRNGNSTGAAWVEVQISTPCSGSPATNRANFTVGSPDIQGYYVAQTNGSVIKSGALLNNQLVSVSVPQSYTVQYSIELTQNLSSVTWNLYGIGNITSSTSTHLYWTMPAYGSSPNNCTVVLNAVGQCGPVSGVYPFQVVGLSGYGYTMLVSPNPATNNINVQIMQVADTSSTANSIDASSSVATSNTLLTNSSATTKFYLCDLYSNAVVKQWQFQEAKSASYNLNITGVRSGTYVLKMERNNKTTTTKILVQ
jgi:hypothetical protein